MGLNQEKKISFHRILIPLCLTRVCVSIFKPQVGFLDVRKCFTDYCTALSIVTTCQKNSGQKILDILSWEPIYLGHLVPQSFPHQKNILGVKLSPQFQVLPPENSHKCPCSVSLYIRHFLSSNPHALSLYEEKKNIRESQSSHQNKFFFTMFFPFIQQIDSSNEKILEP